jgi:hypothetical protein
MHTSLMEPMQSAVTAGVRRASNWCGRRDMKNLLFLIAGITGTIAYMLARQRRGVPAAAPVVDELAHKLQDAWADHHTVA